MTIIWHIYSKNDYKTVYLNLLMFNQIEWKAKAIKEVWKIIKNKTSKIKVTYLIRQEVK